VKGAEADPAFIELHGGRRRNSVCYHD